MNLLLLLHLFIALDPPSIYEINFLSTEGKNISMSSFKGKRILVATIDAENPSAEKISFLDSLALNVNDMQIIIVPAIATDKGLQDDRIKTFSSQMKSNIIISASSKLFKRSADQQHHLFQWLTKVENNLHFDNDGEAEQYFLVSAEGTLYSVMQAKTPFSVLIKLLDIKFDESQHLIYNPETKVYEPRK